MTSEQTHPQPDTTTILPLVSSVLPQARNRRKSRDTGQRTLLSRQGDRRRETERKLELHRRVYALAHPRPSLG